MTDPMTRPGDAEALNEREETTLRRTLAHIFRDAVPIPEDDMMRRLLATLDAARAAHSPVQPVVGGLDVERLARVRFTLIDDIGTELSRELAQGSPFEPYDRIYVAKTITRVLDAARDRASLAAGSAAGAALATTPEDQS